MYTELRIGKKKMLSENSIPNDLEKLTFQKAT